MGSRRLTHPEAKLEEIAARVEETRAARSFPEDAWRWPYGFVLRLWEPSGAVHTRELPGRSYDEAAAQRDLEMAGGRYEKAWLVQKTSPALDK